MSSPALEYPGAFEKKHRIQLDTVSIALHYQNSS
jgi:hypothetical protein